MEGLFTKAINSHFFKEWNSEMSYVLGYITADGCISMDKKRKNPFSLNITSAEKKHLYKIRKALGSTHKIGKKIGGYSGGISYQIQLRNPVICNNLINLGILPRKTYNLNPIKVPNKYFSDFVRGFFDGDGTVYIYTVNSTPQIKTEFVSTSLPFITEFNKDLCKGLNIPQKAIHKQIPKIKNKVVMYSICLYVDDCERLNKFMYQKNPSLYLPRKYKVFEKWKTIKRRKYTKQNYPSKVGWQLNQNYLRTN